MREQVGIDNDPTTAPVRDAGHPESVSVENPQYAIR